MSAWWTALRRTPPPLGPELEPWFDWHRQVRAPTPYARAVLASARADRAAMAFVSGYQAALAQLLGDHGLAALAVTEAEGNHPRAVKAELDPERGTVSGTKTFLTLGHHADTLWVVARDRSLTGHRPRLVVARLAAGGPGQQLTEGPATPFVPEVGHAVLVLHDAPVAEIREGDGYDEVVKPFRTVEDLHVLGALLGYALGAVGRQGGHEPWRAAALSMVVAGASLAAERPTDTAVHLALSGLWDQAAAHLAATPWPDAHRDRWQRDRALLQVAHGARRRRAERAWDRWRG
jgi:hypothetical protein